MRRLLLLGVMLLLLSSVLVAQSNTYYWADGNQIRLKESSTHFILTADEAITLTNLSPLFLKTYESWRHKPYAVAETFVDLTVAQLEEALGIDPDLIQISPAYALSDGFVIYPTRTIVAKLLNKEDQVRMERLVEAYGVKNISEKYGTFRIELDDVTQVLAAANALEESKLFQFAHPDFYAPIVRHQVNDPLFNQQFQMNNTGQTLDGVTGAVDADCNALEAWNISLGSSGTTVAVIDDGLENHEDFNNSSGQSRYTAGFSPANNGNGNAVNGSAHGVSCAGSIAASHNSIGVRGVAPLANMISVNIFVGGESTQDLADGFTWAKNQGADVISNSWGYTSCTLNFSNLNNAMADANANGRGGLGCVIVFSSGNGYKSCVDYPGNNTNVIAVGAFANTGIRSAYSNYGSALDIMAPSNNVGGPGAGVRTTDRMGSPGYSSGNYTGTFGGTSSSCPVVAGVATLVLGYNPSLSSSDVKNILYSTAIDMGPAGVDAEYANGRVNAFAALQAAGGGGGPTCSDGIQNGQETGVDCGGPDCPSCPTGCNGTEVVLSITLDNYPEETSWVIRNDGGAIVASGGTYGSFPDGSNVTENICLADDCYTFTIEDSFGDGICCAYGTGSYTLSNGGTVLASGGNFGASEATDFCIGGGGPDTSPPTQPTNLTVSNEQDTQVTLSWNASSDNIGVTGYEVSVDGNVLGTTAGTTVNITGLTACTSYNFGVRALDAAGNVSGTATAVGSTTGCSSGGTPFTEGYFFETGLQGWIDGGSDCARRNTSFSWEGNFSIRLRDNSGTASSMTSPAYDLAGLGSVEISFYFYPNSMENGEDFWVRYNDGSGWQTVATYASGSSFNNGSFYSATVTLDAGTYNLTDGAQFRIQCDASGNGDQVYIDQVTVTGSNASGSNVEPLVTIQEIPTLSKFNDLPNIEADVELFPNPTSDLVTVRVLDEIQQITVFNIQGQVMFNRMYGNLMQTDLNVSRFVPGVYLIMVQTDEEVVTERLIIQR
ncbi:MAG: S8 family serine peptidase [Bacteroidota bacterium]